MKVRITTQHGQFEAELDEGVTVNDLFPLPEEQSLAIVRFVVYDDAQHVRVTMLKSLIRIVEEDL